MSVSPNSYDLADTAWGFIVGIHCGTDKLGEGADGADSICQFRRERSRSSVVIALDEITL